MSLKQRLLVVLICFLMLSLVHHTTAQALPSWPGKPGVITQSAFVNFTDLAPSKETIALSSVATLHEDSATIAASPSPAIVSSFPAYTWSDGNDYNAPDTQGAVGPNHIMVTLNWRVRILDRKGNVLRTVLEKEFWQSVSPSSQVSDIPDARVAYDPYGNRWIFIALATDSPSGLLIGTSQSSDPTGNWFLHRITINRGIDFPSFGFNKNWVVVRVNLDNAVQIYAIDKSKLYAGVQPSFTLFERSDISATHMPAITYDATVNEMYLLVNWNGNDNRKGVLRLFSITGAIGSEQLNDLGFITISDPWANAIPGNAFSIIAPQLGSPEKIATNSVNIQNLVYRNGSLWATQTIFLPADLPTRSSVQWMQISTTGSIIQRGRIDDQNGNLFYAFPSIAVNKDNDAMIGYSRFSANQYPSANYSYRINNDPSNTLRGDFTLKDGEALYYNPIFGINRWGDYSNTVVDPLNDTDMWTIQEYAATPINTQSRWGMWWGQLVLKAYRANLPFIRK